MKKLRIRSNEKDGLVCLCGNTTAQGEGFEEAPNERIYGVYIWVCRRCGVKFDDDTLEIVGMRCTAGCNNELVAQYAEQVARQARRYWWKNSKGVTRP